MDGWACGGGEIPLNDNLRVCSFVFSCGNEKLVSARTARRESRQCRFDFLADRRSIV